MLDPRCQRTILHVAADCFFTSCHLAGERTLAGRPVAVAGAPGHRCRVVLSASYEAQGRDVRAGQPLTQALRLCPDLVVLRPDFALYRERSARLHAVLRDLSPLVESCGLDEAWVELPGCRRAAGSGPLPAQAIQRRLARELGLPASVGVGPNKLLAKMASGLHRPRGLTVLSRADVPALLWPLPAGELFGVGPALAARLRAQNVGTIGDLARLGPAFCERRLGQAGRRLWMAAHGRDDSPVEPSAGADPKSVGASVTLARDLRTGAEARRVLSDLAERVARRLRGHRVVAGSVAVTLRDAALGERSSRAALGNPTDDAALLLRAALRLAGPELDGTGLRLLGLRAERLRPADLAEWEPSLWDAGAWDSEARRRAAERSAAVPARQRPHGGAQGRPPRAV